MPRDITRSASRRIREALCGWNFTSLGSEDVGLPDGVNISVGGNIGEICEPIVKVTKIRFKFPHDVGDSVRVMVVDGIGVIAAKNQTFSDDELAALAGCQVERRRPAEILVLGHHGFRRCDPQATQTGGEKMTIPDLLSARRGRMPALRPSPAGVPQWL